MNDDETEAATQALFSWFRSQDITPANSVLVMATALRSVIQMLAKKNQKSAKRGLELVTKMLLEDRV